MQSQISPIQNLLALKFRHQSGLIQHRVENAGFRHQNGVLGCGVNVDVSSQSFTWNEHEVWSSYCHGG